MPDRDHDIVLFGATGFTGELTAHYLAEHAPDGLRWALAGRNRAKLEAVRDRLVAAHPGLSELPLLEADSHDDRSLRAVAESTRVVITTVGPYLMYGEPLVAACAKAGTDYVDLTGEPEFVDRMYLEADSHDDASLRAVAESTRVVITTVGPYLMYGEPLVAACAKAGTDYVDLTGEPEFVDRMYLEHHDEAVASGARLVHACGFDSIPHDLGAFYTVRQLGSDEPITLRGVVRAGGTFSGGTFHSALGAMSRAKQMRAAMADRRKKEGRPEGRSSRAVQGTPTRDRVLGLWLLPMPTIDPFVVARSGAALAAYGPKFRYSHYAGVKTLRYTVGGVAAVSGLVVAAQVPPLRKALKKRIKQGDGPSESRRATSWFTVDFVAESAGRTLHTRVSGGDPGYDETAKMLAESALCLALDDNPTTSGQVTTAVAMGEHLLTRLKDAGIRFETVA